MCTFKIFLFILDLHVAPILPTQSNGLYEVVSTFGDSNVTNIKYKISYIGHGNVTQKRIFKAPSDISWPFLKEKLQLTFPSVDLDECMMRISSAIDYFGF